MAKVCIIGAGSSGIAACQVLGARGIEFDCFEKGSGSLFITTSRTTMQCAAYPMPDVDFHPYMRLLARERKRARGERRALPASGHRVAAPVG